MTAPPEDFSALGEAWAADLAALGPWREAGGLWRGPALAGLPGTVRIHAEAASSQDEAWRLHKRGALADWDSVLVARQTAGRGRMRRAWDSPPGNLHASLAWPKETVAGKGDGKDDGGGGWPLPDMTQFAAALALLEALRGLGARGLVLKWPNDLLQNGRKAAGVLVEERTGPEGARQVVGMGLNLAHAPAPEAMRPDAAVSAGLLERLPTGLPVAPGPLRLWLALAPVLAGWAGALTSGEDREGLRLRLADQLTENLAWRGLSVRVSGGDFDKLVGRVVGMGVQGELRLLAQGREHLVSSGGISPA